MKEICRYCKSEKVLFDWGAGRWICSDCQRTFVHPAWKYEADHLSFLCCASNSPEWSEWQEVKAGEPATAAEKYADVTGAAEVFVLGPEQYPGVHTPIHYQIIDKKSFQIIG